jgi:hypothetical protein
MILSIQTFADGIIANAENNPGIYITILFALFELFVRLRPTKKNLSILAKISTLINFVIPNYSKEKAVNDANKLIRKKFPY